MSARLLEVSLLLGVGTVLRLERNAWSMVKRLRQATKEYSLRREGRLELQLQGDTKIRSLVQHLS